MKVRCLINNVSDILNQEARERLARFIHLPDGDNDLDIDAGYDVQALEYRDGNLWLYLHAVESNEYPFPYPLEFFLIEDSSLPFDWEASFAGGKSLVLKRITFREWAHDDRFFERLIDGEPGCVATYTALRQF